MKPSEPKNNPRISEALAFLEQEIEGVLERASESNLMKIKCLEEIPQEKRGVIEDQLWNIFVYGEYYLEYLIQQPSQPILSIRLSDFYNEKYKPLIRKIYKLIPDLLKAPRREYIENHAVELEADLAGNYKPLESLENPVDYIIDEYEFDARNGHLIDTIKTYIRAQKNGSAFDASPSSSNKNSIKDSFREARDALFIATGISALIEFCLPLRPTDIMSAEDAVCRLCNRPDPGLLDATVRENRLQIIKKIVCENSSVNWDNPLLGEAQYEKLTEIQGNCDKILRADYFSPDDWITNEKELSPIIVTDANIPEHIKKRINEIYASFIFGNWMSVIALSRCLLEYAIIDRTNFLAEKLKKNICFYTENKDTKPLGELVKTAGSALPKLTDSMYKVKNLGNEIMHPPPDSYHDNPEITGLRKVKALVPPGKNSATSCFQAINKIIGVLYSQ